MSKLSKEEIYKNMSKNLRFYRKELPEKDEPVYAFIKNFSDMGIDCYLTEYKKDAFMSFKDASSSRKLKNIKKEVIKNRNYVLTAINIDNKKGFIDVDKRTMDKDIEAKYTDLVLFYQKIFNIFTKIFIFNNLNSNLDDVYNFLEKTLWKTKPEDVMKNMLGIHQNTRLIQDIYNLNDNIGKQIVNNLLKSISKPLLKKTIRLKINSLSLNASEDIKNILLILGNKLDCTFVIDSVPIYSTTLIDEYDTNIDQIKFSLENKVKKCIEDNKKKDLYVIIDNIDIATIQDNIN